MPEIFFIAILAILCLLIVARLAPIARSIARKWRIRRSGIDDITDGQEFEIYITHVLRKNGFKDIVTTPRTGDYGADVIAEKDGERYAIQCKLYSKSVGVKAVQEVFAAMLYYGCDAAAVATNSRFSKNAINLAESTGVQLWDRDVLVNMGKRA
ncbi:MAG: restriction endonuclease [Oscillospiraceae bacterium]|nr:restriction endonuclease [Oscillospiraceae bacterium]